MELKAVIMPSICLIFLQKSSSVWI